MPKKILIIEDDPSILEDLDFLLNMEGFQTEVAVNGQEGLDKLHSMETPCLILLDLMMPVMNGWQFLEQRSKLDKNKQSRVLIMSAMADQAMDLVVEGHIKKPFDIGNLLQFVKEHC